MACKIIYKGISYAESDFKSQIERYVAINNLFNENETLTNAVYEALGFVNNMEFNKIVLSIADNKNYIGGSSGLFQQKLLNRTPNDIDLMSFEDNIDDLITKLKSKGLEINKISNKSLLANNVEVNIDFLNKDILNSKDEFIKGFPLGKQFLKEGKINPDYLLAIKKIDNRDKDISDLKNQITPQQKQQSQQLYSQYLESLNKPNTNPILQGNQQEQVKKFAELQERLNDREFIEGAKGAYESSKGLQEWGTQEQYNDYIARVSLGITKNPTSGGYNYTSKVRDIVYHGSPKTKLEKIEGISFWTNESGNAYGYNIQRNDDNSAGFVTSAIVNIKSPYIHQEDVNSRFATTTPKDLINTAKSKNADGAIWKDVEDIAGKETQTAVFEPEQIHILGSKQDIEGFKEFVNEADPSTNFNHSSNSNITPCSL